MLTRITLALAALTFLATSVLANGLLDGRTFSGQIGPAENPDLDDKLHFDQGHFWSDICTRCGFVPGPYTAQSTADGITFTGTLESEGRGTFEYTGLIGQDGSIDVTIQWEKARWYWTWRREIAFRGSADPDTGPANLAETQAAMSLIDPTETPLCARF